MVTDNNTKNTVDEAFDLDRVEACYLLDLPFGSEQQDLIEANFKMHYKKAFKELQQVRDEIHHEAIDIHIQALKDARNVLLGRAKAVRPTLTIPSIII